MIINIKRQKQIFSITSLSNFYVFVDNKFYGILDTIVCQEIEIIIDGNFSVIEIKNFQQTTVGSYNNTHPQNDKDKLKLVCFDKRIGLHSFMSRLLFLPITNVAIEDCLGNV